MNKKRITETKEVLMQQRTAARAKVLELTEIVVAVKAQRDLARTKAVEVANIASNPDDTGDDYQKMYFRAKVMLSGLSTVPVPHKSFDDLFSRDDLFDEEGSVIQE